MKEKLRAAEKQADINLELVNTKEAQFKKEVTNSNVMFIGFSRTSLFVMVLLCCLFIKLYALLCQIFPEVCTF